MASSRNECSLDDSSAARLGGASAPETGTCPQISHPLRKAGLTISLARAELEKRPAAVSQ